MAASLPFGSEHITAAMVSERSVYTSERTVEYQVHLCTYGIVAKFHVSILRCFMFFDFQLLPHD